MSDVKRTGTRSRTPAAAKDRRSSANTGATVASGGQGERAAIGLPPEVAGQQTMAYSPAMRAGDFVFVSGQVPFGENGELVAGGIEAQTRQVMRNLVAVLSQAECTLAHLVKVTVFLSDPRDFWAFNQIYRSFYEGAPPARSTVCTSHVVDARIEIDAIAYNPRRVR
jgi:reactive intermediate/imine deaminase